MLYTCEAFVFKIEHHPKILTIQIYIFEGE
jgi:hypothetical protein